MCGAVGYRKTRIHPGDLGLLEPEVELVKVTFPNPRAALLMDEDRDLWLPWGRRREQPGGHPEGGWAREESLSKPFWTRWQPQVVWTFPAQWMEKDPSGRSHWFEVPHGQGIRCLRLDGAPGTPVYVITVPSQGEYQDIHDRMPALGHP